MMRTEKNLKKGKKILKMKKRRKKRNCNSQKKMQCAVSANAMLFNKDCLSYINLLLGQTHFIATVFGIGWINLCDTSLPWLNNGNVTTKKIV
jgi:hypothetical protein